MSVYPGHVIAFLPQDVTLVWRSLVWIGFVAVFYRLIVKANQRQWSRALALGRVSLAMFMLPQFILNSFRFTDPATWEGLPFTTVGLILAWIATGSDEPPEILLDKGGGE